MFRKMRRFKQELSSESTIKILESGSHGTLAVLGDEGYPYAVPLSYVYTDGRLYFHCAPDGHKLDALRNSDKASFCVVARDEVIPERLTTIYASAIAFGKAKIIEDVSEKRRALELLSEKYTPAYQGKSDEAVSSAWDRVCVVAFEIEHLSGKASMDIINSEK